MTEKTFGKVFKLFYLYFMFAFGAIMTYGFVDDLWDLLTMIGTTGVLVSIDSVYHAYKEIEK